MNKEYDIIEIGSGDVKFFMRVIPDMNLEREYYISDIEYKLDKKIQECNENAIAIRRLKNKIVRLNTENEILKRRLLK